MIKTELNGMWEVFIVPPGENRISDPQALADLTPVAGTVPGNLELELYHAGLAPDPAIGENARSYRKYEFYDFWYRKYFEVGKEQTGRKSLLHCEGVDCFAEYFLNGKKIGESANALIPFSFSVELQEKNELCIRIISAEIKCRDFPVEEGAFSHLPQVYSSLYARKGAHVFGWDIAPRLALGGIWKEVFLTTPEEERYSFKSVSLSTVHLSEDLSSAEMELFYDFDAGENTLDGYTLRFQARCGSSTFTVKDDAYFTSGRIRFTVEPPCLWYPRGYGEARLYTLHCELLAPDGKCAAYLDTFFGIRSCVLERTDLNEDGKGVFRFVINHTPVRVLGSNHVPLDALHSRDKERMKPVLDLFNDLQCNMIRCWGGGVYESDEFYDYCDRHGIMVWQDFMFSGTVYPQNEIFFDMIRKEGESVIKRLNRHVSIVLWCGDNECDDAYLFHKLSPQKNRLNREVLPDLAAKFAPGTPYLPSSPYISPEAESHLANGNYSILPERHLWGPRETFKLPFYYQSKAHFISETGWHGCPNLSSLERFLEKDHLKLDDQDVQWDFRSSNPFRKYSYMETRSQLIGKQLMEYFRESPRDLLEYARASQIHQAEACKFMVETCRLDRDCSGILWWNVIDCWGQFSDAVVDYYFGKKLAYHYLKRSQTPFCICCSEPNPWDSKVTAVNDSNETAEGSFTVEGDDGSILLQGDFKVKPGTNKVLGLLRSPRARNSLWLIRWESSGRKGCNHYISGNIVMDYTWYMACLEKIASLDGSFRAEDLAL